MNSFSPIRKKPNRIIIFKTSLHLPHEDQEADSRQLVATLHRNAIGKIWQVHPIDQFHQLRKDVCQ